MEIINNLICCKKNTKMVKWFVDCVNSNGIKNKWINEILKIM